MTPSGNDLLKRNFVLKRVGKELFLPCTEAIGCHAPPYVPGSAFVTCEAISFNPATGELLLNSPTDYTPKNAASYEDSVWRHSDAILAAGVKTFKILHGGSHWLEPVVFNPTPAAGSAPAPPKPLAWLMDEIIPVAFTELVFDTGVIRFTKAVHTQLDPVSFDVTYPASCKEYDAIKSYFEKVLGKKTVDCRVTINAAGREVLSKKADFVQENQFDFALIERVRDYIVQKTILENEEAISIVDEKLELLSPLDETLRTLEGLLDALGKFKPSKHYHHLRYLASLHAAESFRLRMTGSPVSFIFVITGAQHFFLIWETYETKEATYIWQLESRDGRPTRKEMDELVETIKWLRDGHKKAYLESPRPNFHRIHHDYSQPDGGLMKWKGMLGIVIT